LPQIQGVLLHTSLILFQEVTTKQINPPSYSVNNPHSGMETIYVQVYLLLYFNKFKRNHHQAGRKVEKYFKYLFLFIYLDR
jgi:hypothetical protein